MNEADILIIGAGAAGLAAGIFAGEQAHGAGMRIVLLDGAKKPGAKILVSGGGRCNVTNERVTPDDFWGGPRPMIRNVLRAFDEKRTLEWMRELGVELKLEPTGKYFPASDSARTVLKALLDGLERAGCELFPGSRVEKVERAGEGFLVYTTDQDPWTAKRVILATGGMSLPKSGSDGWGFRVAKLFGHCIEPPVPALVPLTVKDNPFVNLSGLTLDLRIGLYDHKGRPLESRVDSLLFTHFGISGPAALNISRHLLRARQEDLDGEFRICIGVASFNHIDDADKWLLEQARAHPKRTLANVLGSLVPERFARMLAGDIDVSMSQLSKQSRKMIAENMVRLPLNIEGSRGWAFAETTAGGVNLREMDIRTMESRKAAGLYLCGEMLDVDGRIGGFNFQWAWATGYLAGRGAVSSLIGG